MTHPVTITGLTRVPRPKPNQGNSTILAYFDCEVAGFALRGCAFVRTNKNGLVAWPPRIETAQGGPRSVAITDDSIRHAMMLHAREAYRALGGTDAEYIGQARTVSAGPRPWGTDLEVGGIMHTPPERPFRPHRKGDVGYDGFPLERDLTDEEAEAGLAKFLDNHSLATSRDQLAEDAADG